MATERANRNCKKTFGVVVLPVIAMLAISGLVGAAVWQDRQKTIATVERLSETLAFSIANSLEASLDAADLIAKDARFVIERMDLGGSTATRDAALEFLTIAESLPWVNGMTFADFRGRLTFVAAKDSDGAIALRSSNFDVSENPSFQFHKTSLEDRVFISKPDRNIFDQSWQIGVSRAVRKNDGTFLGVVFVIIPVTYVTELFESVLLPGENTASVFYDDSTWLTNSLGNQKEIGTRNEHLVLFQDYVPNAPHGVFHHYDENLQAARVAAFKTLDDYPFVVTVGWSRDFILHGWRTSARNYALAVLAVALVVAFLSVRMYQSVRRDQQARLNLEDRERRLSQANAAILSQSQFLQATLDSLPNPVAIKDDQHRYVMINMRYARIFNHDRSTAIGRSLFDLGWPEDLARASHETDDQVLRDGKPVTITRRNMMGPDDADQKWIQITKIPFSTPDERTLLLVVGTDVTRLRQQDELDAQRQKLEALGRMAGNVAHEINNVLQPILTYSSLGADLPGAGQSHAKSKKYFGVIQTASDYAANLLQNMLMFARRDLPADELFAPAASISETLELLGPSIPPGIQLKSEISTSSELIRFSRNGLRQVITNLILNAVDAMEGHGQLEISSSTQTLDTSSAARVELESGQYIVIEVSDTGSGIDPDVQRRMFEPFFSTKEAERGTGLGLSVALGLVIDAGGILRFDSEPGHGTTFQIYLPVAQAAQAAAE